MPDTEQEQPHRRSSRAHVESQEAPAQQDEVNPAPPQEYVDPYKMVYSPWELPSNTAAAQAIAAQLGDAVDPEAPISNERKAQAEAAIQEHQDNVQEALAGVTDDPRLTGSTFADAAAQQAQDAAARAAEKEEANA